MTRRRLRSAAICAAVACAVGSGHRVAGAQPLRLRGDALAAVESPVGLLRLEAEGDLAPSLRAEAVVWMGGSSEGGADGEALLIAVQARREDGRAAAELGRILPVVGALRPLHLDGAWGRVVLPWRWTAEAFGGVPVTAGASGRRFDWLAGGRVGRRVGDFGSAGLAYLHQRDGGARAFEELALDAGTAIGRRADAAARLTFDLIQRAPAELQLSAAWRRGGWRGEAFFSERRPSHLVPATSLFSVLGEVTARKLGGRAAVLAAPRLELSGEAALRDAGELGGERRALDGALRAELALGDRRGRRERGAGEVGAIALELRRSGDGGARDRADGWLGVRAATRLPLGAAAGGAMSAAAELELVRPDDGGRGALWPWALASLRWGRGPWEAALAVEASASPSQTSRLDALARLTRRWELR